MQEMQSRPDRGCSTSDKRSV